PQVVVDHAVDGLVIKVAVNKDQRTRFLTEGFQNLGGDGNYTRQNEAIGLGGLRDFLKLFNQLVVAFVTDCDDLRCEAELPTIVRDTADNLHEELAFAQLAAFTDNNGKAFLRLLQPWVRITKFFRYTENFL